MSYPAIHLFIQDDVPPETVDGILAALQARYGMPVNPERFSGTLPSLPDEALATCLLDDTRFIDLWQQARERPIVLLPFPWSGNPLTRQAFGLEAEPARLLERLEDGNLAPARFMLLADGQPVLNAVRLGSVPELHGQTGLARLRTFFRTLFFLRMRAFRLTTAKGQRIELAALTLEAAEEAWMARHHPERFADPPLQGRVTALVHAPTSLVSLLQSLFRPRRGRASEALPRGLGFVKSSQLVVEAIGGPVPCRIDGLPRDVERITLEAVPTRCRIPQAMDNLQTAEDKESIRLDPVPTGSEAVEFFTRRSLPLLPIAPEAQFAELFTLLRRQARTGSVYLVLMFLSTLLATIGLYQNSGPVIIGAMILAPLMAPLVALSMGLIRLDTMLMRHSTRTLLAGVLMALALAALFAWSLPLAHLTDQIRARLNPTLLDLGVAVVSGIAAAYAHAREELARSLAGVAIAVALIPPLSVAGIGIGLGNATLFGGAFLLFLTNLVGIVFAAGATFYLLGFTSLRYARTAFFYKLLVLLAVAVPLFFSTQVLIQENRIYRQFASLRSLGHGERLELLAVRQTPAGPVARVRLILPRARETRFDRDALVRRLQQRLDAAIELEVVAFYPRP